MAALNLSDEALRNLVQGPGDVEWRQVTSCRATFTPCEPHDGPGTR